MSALYLPKREEQVLSKVVTHSETLWVPQQQQLR